MWSRIKKWLESRKSVGKCYDEEKKEFELAMGQPVISIRISMPEGFEEFRTEFLNLETDDRFTEEVEALVKKKLLFEKRRTRLAS